MTSRYFTDMRRRIRALDVDKKTKSRLLSEESKFGLGVVRLCEKLGMPNKSSDVMAYANGLVCHAQKHNYGIVHIGPDLDSGENQATQICARCGTSVIYRCEGGSLSNRSGGYNYHPSPEYLMDGRAQGISSIEFKDAVAYLYLIMQIEALETGNVQQLNFGAEQISA